MDNDIILVIVVAAALALRLHQRLPRHGQRRRDDDLDAGDVTAPGRRRWPRRSTSSGAFISLAVAATIANGIVDAAVITPTIVFAGLVGATAWNLITWYFGLPSSSSHALIGGVIGAAFAAEGAAAINGKGVVEKVLIPALIAPTLAFGVAALAIMLAYRIVGRLRPGPVNRGYRLGQIVSGSLFSLAHGTNDAQKTMGVITLALISNGNLNADAADPHLGRRSRRPARSPREPTSAAGASSARWAPASSRWTRRRASRPSPPVPWSSSPPRTSATRCRRPTRSPGR